MNTSQYALISNDYLSNMEEFLNRSLLFAAKYLDKNSAPEVLDDKMTAELTRHVLDVLRCKIDFLKLAEMNLHLYKKIVVTFLNSENLQVTVNKNIIKKRPPLASRKRKLSETDLETLKKIDYAAKMVILKHFQMKQVYEDVKNTLFETTNNEMKIMESPSPRATAFSKNSPPRYILNRCKYLNI